MGQILCADGRTFELPRHVAVGTLIAEKCCHRRWFGLSVLERLMRALPEVDVTIVGSPPAWRS
jgi:hypothetical protein